MKILSAAIQFHDVNHSQIIVSAFRHADAYEYVFKTQMNVVRTSAIEGFITDTFSFVDRAEAKIIAKRANQLVEDTPSALLYSEDIWPE